jgi:hypothetical protein
MVQSQAPVKKEGETLNPDHQIFLMASNAISLANLIGLERKKNLDPLNTRRKETVALSSTQVGEDRFYEEGKKTFLHFLQFTALAAFDELVFAIFFLSLCAKLS